MRQIILVFWSRFFMRDAVCQNLCVYCFYTSFTLSIYDLKIRNNLFLVFLWKFGFRERVFEWKWAAARWRDINLFSSEMPICAIFGQNSAYKTIHKKLSYHLPKNFISVLESSIIGLHLGINEIIRIDVTLELFDILSDLKNIA